MRIAIMQPYFVPYIGYWQLLASVDKFVLLDDVNYINRGWINRNYISINNSPKWLTLPLSKASQNKLICDIALLDNDGWHQKMQRTLSLSYSKAPYYFDIEPIISEIISHAHGNLSSFLSYTLSLISDYLNITPNIISTSRGLSSQGLSGQDRILDICKNLEATHYINLPGGKSLYNVSTFHSRGIQLCFLDTSSINPLRSGISTTQPLSILDTLVYNSPESIRSFILDSNLNF